MKNPHRQSPDVDKLANRPSPSPSPPPLAGTSRGEAAVLTGRALAPEVSCLGWFGQAPFAKGARQWVRQRPPLGGMLYGGDL